MQDSLLMFETTSAQRRRVLIELLKHNFGEKNTAYLLTHYDQARLLDRVHLQRVAHHDGNHVVADSKWSLNTVRGDYSRFYMPETMLDLEKLLSGLKPSHVVAHDVATISGMDPTVAMMRQGMVVDGEPTPRLPYSDKVGRRRTKYSSDPDDIIEGFVLAAPMRR